MPYKFTFNSKTNKFSVERKPQNNPELLSLDQSAQALLYAETVIILTLTEKPLKFREEK